MRNGAIGQRLVREQETAARAENEAVARAAIEAKLRAEYEARYLAELAALEERVRAELEERRLEEERLKAARLALEEERRAANYEVESERTTEKQMKYNQHGTEVNGVFRFTMYEAPPGEKLQTLKGFAKALSEQLASRQHPLDAAVRFVNQSGEPRWVTIQRGTPEMIEARINAMYSGDAGDRPAGSDQISEGMTVDTSLFRINEVLVPEMGKRKIPGTQHRVPHPHFHLVDFAANRVDNNCLLITLRTVAKHMAEAGSPEPAWEGVHCKRLRKQLNLPSEGNIPATQEIIEQLAAFFRLRVEVITGMSVPSDEKRKFDDNDCRVGYENMCTTIATPTVLVSGGLIEWSLCQLYMTEDHCMWIKSINDNIRTCPITGDIVPTDEAGKDTRSLDEIRDRVNSQKRDWFTKALPFDEKKETTKKKRLVVIVYDYETYYTDNGVLEPYALGYAVLDPKDREGACKECGKTGCACCGELPTQQIIRTKGRDAEWVSRPLLNLLATAPSDVRYLLVSFNGAHFDHFLLARAAVGYSDSRALTSVFATASAGIRGMTLFGRHQTLDLAKLLPGMSLKNACKGFDTIPSKMDGFSHIEVQERYASGEFETWLGENRVKLSEYLNRDVRSTASLYLRVQTVLPSMTGLDDFSSPKAQTIGSHAWAKMVACCQLPRAVPTHEMDIKIREHIVGGRVQVYSEVAGADPAKVISGAPLTMLDVVSLYPTVMAALDRHVEVFGEDTTWGMYPTDAEPIEVTEYIPGRIGVYTAVIHEQPAGMPNIVASREETLNWDKRGEFEAKVSQMELELLAKHGGRFTVKSGMVWPAEDCERGIFRNFIVPLAKLKDRQDTLMAAPGKCLPKEDGSGETEHYNPALRSMLKLLMNSASGKCCQANYDDIGVLAKGSHEQLLAMQRMNQDEPISVVPLSATQVMIFGKRKTDSIYSAKTAKPSILAVLIYSYARAFLWRTMCRNGILYSDTDSGVFTPENHARIRAEFPQLNPEGRAKYLGDLDDELPAHDEATMYRIAPKDYAIFMRNKQGELITSKVRAKGVRLTDRLINDGALETLRGIKKSVHESSQAYHESSVSLSRPLTDPAASEEFYARRARGEKVYVFTSQLTRVLRSNSAAKSFTLQQRFMIKEL